MADETRRQVDSGKITIADTAGRFLSNFSYVLGTLGFYLLLTIGTFICLAIPLDRYRAATITYDVATGGDPLKYITELEKPCPVLWGWIVVFHVLAWLIVPVLAATAVDAAYRKWDESKDQAERRLRTVFRALGREQLQLGETQLKDFEDTWIDAARKAGKSSST